MNNEQNNKEIIKATREFRDAMTADTAIIEIAKMLGTSADRLDVTTVALRQANALLASQSLELKSSVAAEIEWEKAMMQALGEDGIADVVNAIEKLKADGAALAAENAGLKSWAIGLLIADEEAVEVYPVTASDIPTAPATAAALAEIRAQALDDFANAQDEQAKKYYEISPGCSGQNECQYAAGQAWYFAKCIRQQLRKGASV